jgi:flavin-dependent dehydrogenase
MRTDASGFEVLVVGARCAGAATAMLLARRGLKVLAVDRGAYGADTLSTHALMRGAVLQLGRWGLLPRLREMATPPVLSTTFHYGQEAPVEVEIRAGPGGDALYAPRRTVLDSLLVDAAVEAGAEVRHGHAVVALLRRGGGARVVGAVVRDREGRPYRLRVPLVIGADGLGSTVARLLEMPPLKRARATTGTLYGHWSGLADAGQPEGYHWHFAPGAGAGVIPTNAGRHCVFVAVTPERLRDVLRGDQVEGYRAVLREVAPGLAVRLEAVELESRLWPFTGRRGFLRRAYGPGWALVGDAGYFKDPLTAHGITDALRDAELLADAASAGTEAAMLRYAEARDALSLPLFAATEAIAALDWGFDALKAQHAALHRAMRQEVDFLVALPTAILKETTP